MGEMNDTKTIAIGIDPGKDGALAMLWPEYGSLREDMVRVLPFDKSVFLRNLEEASRSRACDYKVVCVLEHVGAMPGQGSVSMFNFGQNFGWIQGVLDALGVPYELVRPQKWKKEFSCTSDKNTSIEVARRLFPDVDLRRTLKCKGPHDGICEALLMAEYARRRLA